MSPYGRLFVFGELSPRDKRGSIASILPNSEVAHLNTVLQHQAPRPGAVPRAWAAGKTGTFDGRTWRFEGSSWVYVFLGDSMTPMGAEDRFNEV